MEIIIGVAVLFIFYLYRNARIRRKNVELAFLAGYSAALDDDECGTNSTGPTYTGWSNCEIFVAWNYGYTRGQLDIAQDFPDNNFCEDFDTFIYDYIKRSAKELAIS